MRFPKNDTHTQKKTVRDRERETERQKDEKDHCLQRKRKKISKRSPYDHKVPSIVMHRYKVPYIHNPNDGKCFKMFPRFPRLLGTGNDVTVASKI